MTWLVFGGSLAAIAIVVGVVWLLRLGRGGLIREPAAAADAVAHALPGFAVVNAVVGADGQGALVVGDGGRVAVVKPHGARLAVREVPWRAVRAVDGRVLVETGEWWFGAVALAGVTVLDVRRLAPQLTAV